MGLDGFGLDGMGWKSLNAHLLWALLCGAYNYWGVPTINSSILPSVINPRCRKACWGVGCQVNIFSQFEQGNVVWVQFWAPEALMDDGVQGQLDILSAWKFINYDSINPWAHPTSTLSYGILSSKPGQLQNYFWLCCFTSLYRNGFGSYCVQRTDGQTDRRTDHFWE